MGLIQPIQIISKKSADVVMTNIASYSLGLINLCENNFRNFDSRWYFENNGVCFVNIKKYFTNIHTSYRGE